MRKINGCKTLHKMIREGRIDRPNIWIDDYNQITNDIAGTICVGISFRNHFFVSVYGEQ